MKITREKLKQIIKEELETAMNEEAEGKLTRKDMQMFILQRPSDEEEKDILRSAAGGTLIYDYNNGNVTMVDADGTVLVSYAFDRSRRNPTDLKDEALFKKLIDHLNSLGFKKTKNKSLPARMGPNAMKAMGY